MKTTKRPAVERFWEKVAVAGPDDCWLFNGAKTPDGYGVFRVEGRTGGTGLVYAHRFAWALLNGPIPEGMEMMHSDRCVSRACCNPAHLTPGTHQENVAAANRKKRGKRWGGTAKPVAVAA